MPREAPQPSVHADYHALLVPEDRRIGGVGCACPLNPSRVRASEASGSPADLRPPLILTPDSWGPWLSQPLPRRWPWLPVRTGPSPHPTSSGEWNRGSQALRKPLPDPQGLDLSKGAQGGAPWGFLVPTPPSLGQGAPLIPSGATMLKLLLVPRSSATPSWIQPTQPS